MPRAIQQQLTVVLVERVLWGLSQFTPLSPLKLLTWIIHEAGRSKGQHGLPGSDRHRRPSPYVMAGELSGLIPGSRNADRWREPRKVGERAEASRLGEERVPGRAGRVHHGLVAA